MAKRITLRRFDDMHCHFRLPPITDKVLLFTAKYAGRGVAMPNTKPRPILNALDVVWYHEILSRVLDSADGKPSFTPLMTIEIRDNTTPEIVRSAYRAGAVAGKVYPLGVTTNSDEGLRDFKSKSILETFRAMQDVGMLLLIHGELDMNRVLVTNREEVFLPTLMKLVGMLPKLRIVLEHVSTRAGIETVKQLGPNVCATITAHHLCLTLNDAIGYGIQPHNCCMPIPKSFDDRDALVEAATSGEPKFFLGSDTAPHLREKKECAKGACGVYTAPVLPMVLTEVFESAGRLDRLNDFASRFGAEFYGLPLNEGQITLLKEEWDVPQECNGIVPFRAGTALHWKLIS